jgi:hypothetical protein
MVGANSSRASSAENRVKPYSIALEGSLFWYIVKERKSTNLLIHPLSFFYDKHLDMISTSRDSIILTERYIFCKVTFRKELVFNEVNCQNLRATKLRLSAWQFLESSFANKRGNLRTRITFDVPYHTSRLFKTRMICSLAESSLGSFIIVLAVGREIISLCKTWKPISNIAVILCLWLRRN